MIVFEEAGDLVLVASGSAPGPPTAVWQCGDCGALVVSRDRHLTWHLLNDGDDAD